MAKETNVVTFVPRKIENTTIEQRSIDGYINATAMCKAAGKQFGHYNANDQTKAFIHELSCETGIPLTVLVQSVSGGDPHRQGTWVHPQVAIHLAQWLSAKFAVQVSKWVFDWMSTANDPLRIKIRKDISIPARKNFASIMLDQGVSKPPRGFGIVNITNRMSKNITGHTIRPLRKLLGIVGKKTPRDRISIDQVLQTAVSENKSADYVKDNNIRGDTKCLVVCDEVSKIVHQAFEQINSKTKKIA